MAPIAPGALAESASAKMRFLYSAEYWRRLALTTTSGSGIVFSLPGGTVWSASVRFGVLGVGHRFGLTWRYATFGVASLGLTPLRTRRGQNDRRWWNTVYGLLHEHFLLRPLH